MDKPEPMHIANFNYVNGGKGARCGSSSKNIAHSFKVATCRHCHGYCGCTSAGKGCFRKKLLRKMLEINDRLQDETIPLSGPTGRKLFRDIDIALHRAWKRVYGELY